MLVHEAHVLQCGEPCLPLHQSTQKPYTVIPVKSLCLRFFKPFDFNKFTSLGLNESDVKNVLTNVLLSGHRKNLLTNKII